MTILTFIGLVNYKSSDVNLVNIIFKSDSSDKTTYQYNFSDSLGLPTLWYDIPTLIDVTIPDNTEISAQLNTETVDNDIYYIYIRAYNSISSINTIWQKSNTTPLSAITNIAITNYTDNLQSYTTLEGGSINNNTTNSTSIGTITSNIIYTINETRIIIPTNITYISLIPLFIMSNSTITLSSGLNTNSGSINIVGTATSALGGIYIDTAITIIGNVTLNGTAKYSNGIFISANIINNSSGNLILNGTSSIGYSIYISANISGNVTLNGTGTTHGIYINTAITISGNVTLNGTARRIYKNGIHKNGIHKNGIHKNGIHINAEIIILGNVILNGIVSASGIYGDGIFISGNIINNSSNNLTINGTSTSGYGIYIGSVMAITISGNVILNGTGIVNGDGIYIEAPSTISGNVILNGISLIGYGIYINAPITNIDNIIFNGTASNGNGIHIVATITNIDNVIFNGTTSNGNGIYLVGIIKNIGNVILNGKAIEGYDIYIGDDITITGIFILNGTDININASIIKNSLDNLTLNRN